MRRSDRSRQRPDAPEPAPSRRAGSKLGRDLLVAVAAFGVGVGVAELFGAANLGVAFGVGQVVFALVLTWLLSRG
ncbi:MAG TPA: hypothetical protein VH683_00935 [Thermoleophilaceae bacterium]|jgi:hypothetical protein